LIQKLSIIEPDVHDIFYQIKLIYKSQLISLGPNFPYN